MKANELRIGNLVKSVLTNEYYTINVWALGVIEEGNYQNSYDTKTKVFEPISLTEEWLLKFGFKKTMAWTFVIDIQGGKKLVYYLGEKGWSINHKNYSDFSNLKYVHQLQNLYFALTGEELTIKTDEQ